VKLLVYIPDLLKIIKLINVAIKEGKNELEIRRGLKKLEEAFQEQDPATRAGKQDDVFNEKLN